MLENIIASPGPVLWPEWRGLHVHECRRQPNGNELATANHGSMQDYGKSKGMAWAGFAETAGRTRKEYPPLEAIAQQFVKDVLDAGGDLEDCPWYLPTDASAAAASAASAQPLGEQSTILEFDADGSLDLGQLKSVFGMEVGMAVAPKTDRGGKGRQCISYCQG